VNKSALKKSIAGLAVGVGALLAPLSVSAAAAPSATDDCAKELLLSYFPEPIVNDTLKRFDVPQDKWAGIVKSLSAKDKEVVKTVEKKAAAMNPNPLKDPQQRQAAVKLFRDTLLQVFTEALKENGLTDTSKFQAMLDDIQQQKAKKFAMCMEKQKAQIQQGNQPGSSEDESDEDDEDDYDDEDDTDDSAKDKSAPATTPAKTEPAKTK
jgi:hypothetical protein